MPLFSATTPPQKEQVAALVDIMPPLAGSTLEAPKFFNTRWRVGQRFTSRNDPDRTQEPWHPPKFLQYKNPQTQSQKTSVEELEVPRARRDERFARVVRNALDEEDCAALLAKVNEKGFTPALVNVGMDTQQLMPEVRDGHRIIVDSPELAAWLLEVLRPYLPAQLPNGFRLAGLNERCRFLCYTPGQIFEEHMDGCYRRPMDHPEAGDRSMVTVQLYLHDVPASHGGATTFFPGKSYSVAHQPEAGSVLLFSQNLVHEGSLLREGLKYTLRTEAMYTKRQDFVQPVWQPAKAPAFASQACEPEHNATENENKDLAPQAKFTDTVEATLPQDLRTAVSDQVNGSQGVESKDVGEMV